MRVRILEKEAHWGGMAAAIKWGEFDLDFGPHIYHTHSKDLERIWEREFGGLFVKNEFWCKNVQGENYDNFYDYPYLVMNTQVTVTQDLLYTTTK